VLPGGTRFKIRAGGPDSPTFVGGRIEAGGWVVNEGSGAGRYGSANGAVVAVHDITCLHAWLYVVIEWEGRWTDAEDIRRLPASQLDFTREGRLTWCAREIRKQPKAEGGRGRPHHGRRGADGGEDGRRPTADGILAYDGRRLSRSAAFLRVRLP
jgi:hypothetical protein